MLIHGSLADYNPAEGHSVYVLYDEDTKNVYSKNNVMYLAFSGIKHTQSIDSEDEWATLTLQVDLNRVHVLTHFVLYGNRINAPEKVAVQTLKNKSQHIQSWVWFILFALGCGFKSPCGELFVFGSEDKAKSLLLSTDFISELSDNIITVVSEEIGKPTLDAWVRLPMCQSSPLLGANIFTAASQLAGVEPEVVQNVLFSVGTVIMDAGLRALQLGACAVDFFVPPIGTVELRANPRNIRGPAVTVAMEASSALECAANIAYSSEVRDPVDLIKSVAKVRYHRWDSRNTNYSSAAKYEKEKASGKKPRRRNRELHSLLKDGEQCGKS